MSVLTTLLSLEVVFEPPVSVADVPSDVVVGAGALSVEVVEVDVVVGGGLFVVEVVSVVEELVVDVVLSELVVEVVDSDEVVELVVAVGTGTPEVTPVKSVTPWLWPAVRATRARE